MREGDGKRWLDVMTWDVLHGAANWPMTNVRNLKLPQWRKLAERPANRCPIPLTDFCEWTPKKIDPGDGKKLKGEMWFAVDDQSVFAVAGFWQTIGDERCFAMVTCDPNELAKPIHPKAMITILVEADWDRWLTGVYEDAVALQRPFEPARMSMREPVFPTRKAAT